VVTPKRYELKFKISPEKFSYSGQVNIRIFVGDQPVNIIWLHAVRLASFRQVNRLGNGNVKTIFSFSWRRVVAVLEPSM
jgi:hypothetical protein